MGCAKFAEVIMLSMNQILHNIHSFVITVFLFTIFGCSQTMHYNETLMSVEQLMSVQPDSALNVIQNIDTVTLRSAADKALFALLYVQAEDKNYIDSKDVSMIQTAVNFYKDSDDEYHKMLSYYYLARIEENRREYSQTIINLLVAEKIATNINNHFYLGLIYRSCSNVYDKIYNNVESLNYAKRSYDSFKESGSETYTSWALWRLGCAYHNVNDYKKCIDIMQQVAKIAQHNADKYLYIEALKSKALSHLALHEYDNVLMVYDTLKRDNNFEVGIDDYQNIGLAYIGIGDNYNAKLYMDKVIEIAPSNQWLPYEINKRIGNYENALNALENEHLHQDSILHNVITQNVTQMVTDYHNYTIKSQESEFQHKRKIAKVLIFSLVIIIFLISMIFFQRNRANKKEIENNMLKALNLRNLLQIKETEIIGMNKTIMGKDAETMVLQERLSETERRQEKQLDNLNTAINNLFEQHFATIDQLTSAYYEYQGTINEKHRIYCDVMNIISGLRSDKKVLNEMEKYVDLYRDNLMARFRKNFPNLKENDYTLFLYVISGFSSRAISIFINEKLDVVYNRKSRLKQKISRSSSPEKDIFIQYMR